MIILAWFFLALALLCKALVVVVPAILVCLDVYPLRRLGGSRERWFGPAARRVWLEKVPFIMLACFFMMIAVYAKRQGIRFPQRPDGIGARATQASFSVCFYLIKSIWPSGLCSDYKLPSVPYSLDPWFLGSLVTILGLTAAIALTWKRWPGLCATWAVNLIALAPNAGFVRTSDQVATDRYSYVSSMAIVIIVAYAFVRLGRSPSARRWIVLTALAAVCVLTILTWRQCQTWRDEIALYSRVVAVRPDQADGHNSLGLALEDTGRFGEAEAQFTKARDLDPHFPHPLNNLARLRLREEDYDEAKSFLTESLRRDPMYVDAHTNMGCLLAAHGRWSEAILWYDKALKLSPTVSQAHEAHRFFAAALEHLGRYDEALSHYLETLRIDPQDSSTRVAITEILKKKQGGLPSRFRGVP